MQGKVAAAFVGLGAGLCFSLAFVLGLAGGSAFSVPWLIVDTFASLNLTSGLMVTWAAALFAGLMLREQAPRIALTFAVIAPICGITASASELWTLQQGGASLGLRAAEAVWFLPGLTAASLALAMTLLGLSIQLLFSGTALR